jgi:hypothetical protein
MLYAIRDMGEILAVVIVEYFEAPNDADAVAMASKELGGTGFAVICSEGKQKHFVAFI